jgi:N4-(beta-N-acetylglucosaminyl)-L-asparaginase
MTFTRRDFLGTAALGAVSLTLEAQEKQTEQKQNRGSPTHSVIISSRNGFDYIDEGYEILGKGGDTLDAAMRVVRGPEDDPNDDSVGLGGLPNEAISRTCRLWPGL